MREQKVFFPVPAPGTLGNAQALALELLKEKLAEGWLFVDMRIDPDDRCSRTFLILERETSVAEKKTNDSRRK